jgi:phage repressor protein C with HTH and peptisase S24 domain
MEKLPKTEVEPNCGDLTVPGANLQTELRGSRVRTLGAENGGLAALARLSGVALSTLQRIAAGQDMKVEVMTALAQATGVRLEWLATGTGPMRPAGAGFEEEGAAFSVGQARQAPDGGVLIPRYEARASAGIGTPLDPGWVSEKVLFSAEFIRHRLRRKPENLALIECTGDSMEPTLRDGDELLVDTTANDLRSGAIYILRVSGSLLAKRVQPRLDGTVMIISDNTRYPPEVVTPSEGTTLDIVGEVVWRSGPLRG